MFKKINIFAFILVLACITIISARAADAYQVSGAIDFTFSMYSSKIGGVKDTSNSWTENYSAGISGFVYDPRLLVVTASIGYGVSHLEDVPDADTTTYNLMGSFFSGRTISWDLFAAKGVTHAEGTGGVGGFDIDMMSYGGNVALRLSRLRTRFGGNAYANNNNNSNNNNNNNNNNGNNRNGYGRGLNIPLPDIFFTYSHQEAKSDNTVVPLNDARELMSTSVMYRMGSYANIDFFATNDKYENLLSGSRGENSTVSLSAASRVSSNGDLRIEGKKITRESFNVPSFNNTTTDTRDQTTSLNSELNFRMVNRLAHSYRYDYSFQTFSGGAEYTNHAASGQVQYYVLPEFTLNTGLTYQQSEYFHEASTTAPETLMTYKSGGFFAGANYLKTHSPAFIEPFVFSTGYSLATGFSSLTDSTHDDQRGRYYQNVVNLGLRSTGWKQEVAYLDFNYTSKRDHSPLEMNSWSESFNLGLTSTRLPRTTINANATYFVMENSAGNAPGIFTGSTPNSSHTGRNLTYNIGVDHSVNTNLSLNAGASRGKSKSSASYSLSNIQSQYDTIEENLYAGVTFNYAISRDLSFRSSGRMEKRYIEPYSVGDITTYTANAGFDYRIRRVYMTIDYRYREDVIDKLPRVQSQLLFVRLSRPF